MIQENPAKAGFFLEFEIYAVNTQKKFYKTIYSKSALQNVCFTWAVKCAENSR